MDLSKPSKRGIIVAMANGTLMRMCPRVTVYSESLTPSWPSKMSNATPMMIPGITSGNMMTNTMGF